MMTRANIDLLLHVNMRGAIYMTHAVLARMLERGSGRILMIASESGRVGLAGSSLYADAKAGTMSLNRAPTKEVRAPRRQHAVRQPRPDGRRAPCPSAARPGPSRAGAIHPGDDVQGYGFLGQGIRWHAGPSITAFANVGAGSSSAARRAAWVSAGDR